MTREQTRQLGIEFERRATSMNPALVESKLDTDTIYSFLNEYLTQYINQLYNTKDLLQSGTKTSVTFEDILKALTVHKIVIPSISLEHAGDISCSTAFLPEDYFKYVRSSTRVTKTYKDDSESDTQYLSNKLIKQEEVASILNKPFNSGAIIRNPLAVLENSIHYEDSAPGESENVIKVFTDKYTKVKDIELVYIRVPYRFNVLGYDDDLTSPDTVHSTCDLPFSCFDELVNGAVLLYMSYVNNVDLQKSSARSQAIKALTGNNNKEA